MRFNDLLLDHKSHKHNQQACVFKQYRCMGTLITWEQPLLVRLNQPRSLMAS
jgi:hypothetical protein